MVVIGIEIIMVIEIESNWFIGTIGGIPHPQNGLCDDDNNNIKVGKIGGISPPQNGLCDGSNNNIKIFVFQTLYIFGKRKQNIIGIYIKV